MTASAFSRALRRVFLGLLLVGIAPFAPATSVIRVTFPDLCEKAALIFEGRVIDVQTREEHDRYKHIWTVATFEVLEVIKGPPVPGSKVSAPPVGGRISLEFLGGAVGNRTLRIGDMRVPEPGETGIYFVESLEKRLVHPLYGWSQGHFIVDRGPGGAEEVRSAAGQRVLAIEDLPAAPEVGLSSGTALGVRLAAKPDATPGLTARSFKDAIRRALKARGTEP
jgi:hypothetical protein